MIIGISGKIGAGKDLVGKIIQYITSGAEDAFDSFQDALDSWDEGIHYLEGVSRFNSVFEIIKFADALKDIVCILLGCTREQLEDRDFKEKELGEEWWYYKVLWETPEREEKVKLISYLDAKLFNGVDETDNTIYSDEDVNLIKPTPRLLLQLIGTECMRNIIHPNTWVTALMNKYYGDIEKWKDIKGYEGKYQISSFGRVKGLDRKIIYGEESKGEYHTKKEAILKSTVTGYYKMIKLEGNNSVTIHSLVADAFLPLVEGKDYINHIDQNPLNNFYKNLERCTQSENILSANRNGNGNIGEKQADSKLTEKDVLEIKELLKTTISQKEIAKRYNISTTTICDINKGRKWKHIGKTITKINPILPKPNPNWIITDLRFENELKAVKDKGGITIRINRDLPCEVCKKTKAEQRRKLCYEITCPNGRPKHESETALDNAEFDYTIQNDGTIEDLILKVKEILTKEHII
jgi:hypothetical protein